MLQRRGGSTMISATGKLSFRSIRVKLISGVLILTVPLIVILIYSNAYAVSVVRNQVAESYSNMMNLYMKSMDSGLEDVDKYINNMAGTGMELFAMDKAETEEDYYKAKIALYRKLNDDIIMYKSINGFFVLSPKWDNFLQVQSSQSAYYDETMNIQQDIQDRLKATPDINGFYSNSWETRRIGNVYYLFHTVKSGGLYFGAWVRASNGIAPLKEIRFGASGGMLLATRDGTAMTDSSLSEGNYLDLVIGASGYKISGDKKKVLVVGEQSDKGNFSLVSLIPDDEILEKLPYFQRLATMIPFITLIFIPLGLFFLRKIILLPLSRLMAAMRRIHTGNLSARVEPSPSSIEFEYVHATFNNMMGQIQGLKNDVYEEQISKQREELQALQLQINPHFFLNSLNIIYSLAKVKDYELILEMSQCLIKHFRFMFKSTMKFVHIQDEIEHTKNYLRIQELRFMDSLSSECSIPPYVLNVLVPPLIIQTFVENTIKHSVTLDEPTRIAISIDIVEQGLEPCIQIVIQDSGQGFPDSVLEAIRQGSRLTNEQGEHLGIWNVQRRLNLLYQDRAQIEFSNATPTGAVVKMWLPLNTAET